MESDAFPWHESCIRSGKRIMKHRLTFLLLGMTAAAMAADTFTLTGIDLTTYLGNDNQMTYYGVNQPAGNGWLKEMVNNWGTVALQNNLSKRYVDAGNHSRIQYGDGALHFEVTTTRTPTTSFEVQMVRERSVIGTAIVDMAGASAYALGVVARDDDRLETKPAAAQNGPGEIDRSVAEGQVRTFVRWQNASAWVQEGNVYKKSLGIRFHRIYGKSVAVVPTGSTGNMTAASATSGGKHRIKPTSLRFLSGSGRNFAISGTYNGATAESSVLLEVSNMNNVLLDRASCVGADSTTFSCDFSQLSIPIPNSPTTYKVKFKRNGALAKQMLLTIDPQLGLDGVYVDFKYGDVDGDNEVESAEVALILDHLGKSYPNADFMDAIPGYPDLRVEHLDMDGNGSITMNDYLISVGNIGQIGD